MMVSNQKTEMILLHTENHKDVVYLPLKRSERIKYTCFNISKNYVVFGATSGGLYAFKRNPFSFCQLIPSKESAITHVAISTTENFFAYATNKGIVCILELNENACGKVVMRSDDLSDSEITALCWTTDDNKPTLYIGDSIGRVSFLKLSFLSKNILHLPTTVFMTLDSKIVQLCWLNDYLLVSTLSRCYLSDTVNEQFKQIGQQLRDGLYGACFMKNSQNTRIFCARPGSRLWEVTLDATVHSTHQFKHQLGIPPSSFISVCEEPMIIGKELNKTEWSAQSFNFIKLYDILGRYIFTYKKDAICILNVDKANVLFWSNYFTDIVDVQCISNNIFIWSSNGDFHELVLLSVENCLLTLYLKKHFDLCLDIICSYHDQLTEEQFTVLHPLRDLNFSEIDSEKSEILSNFKKKLEKVSVNGIELTSGIFMVNNTHLSSRLLDDSKLLSGHKHRTTNRDDSEESRKRSHSLPSDLKNLEMNKPKSNFTISSFIHEFQKTDNLYLEMGLYSSPFITLASYEILQDSFAEIGASFSEKFNESSKNLKEKWQFLENKLNFLKNKKQDKTDEPEPEFIHEDVEISYEDDEPIVETRKKKTVEIEFDFSRIVEKCDHIDEDNINITEVIDLFNVIVKEFYSVSEQLGLNPKRSYQCFPFSIIPEKRIFKFKKIFRSFLKRESVLLWFEDPNFPFKSDSSDFEDKYPSLLKEIFSSEELRQDFLLSKLLAIFSELLNASTILESIKSFQFSCYYMSFCYTMKYFQNGEVLERNNCNKNKNHQWPLPVYLNTMLLMISLDQMEVFLEMGLKKNIEPCDIAYMMLHLESNKPDSGDKFRKLFLTYLQRICLIDSSHLKNIQVFCLSIKLFTSINSEFNSFCASCWFLLPQPEPTKVKFFKLGHQLLTHFWKIFENEYTRITSATESDPYSQNSLQLFRRLINDARKYEIPSYLCYKNIENCQHMICLNLKSTVQDIASDKLDCLISSFYLICCLCHRIPVLWKHLIVLQENSPIKLLRVEHFLQLNMIEEVEKNIQSLNVESAREIVNLNVILCKGTCLNCGNKILIDNTSSWDKLAIFILKRLDVKNTLQILSEFPADINLDKRSAILISLPGIGKELRNHVISAVDDHFDVNPVSLEVHKELSNALKVDKSEKQLKIKQSGTSHWGMVVMADGSDQAICYCCSLPLFSKSLIKEDNGGIMVFSCSHTYHTVCLKNKGCTATCLVCDRFLR